MSSCELYNTHREAVRAYCKENNLDFEKADNSVKSWNQTSVSLLHYDEEKGRAGLRDETPMPIMLIVLYEDGKLSFEQTEHTKIHLALSEAYE